MKRNILLILGTTIGAGIFSLPLTLAESGLIPFLLSAIVIGVSTVLLNMYYLEIIASIKGNHQLPGHVRTILGHKWAIVTAVLLYSSTIGALYGYLSLASTFFNNLTGIPESYASLILITLAVGILFHGRYAIERWDMWLTVLKVVMIVSVLLLAILRFSSFSSTPLDFFGTNPFVALGVLIFAFNGFSIIPMVRSKEQGSDSIKFAGMIIFTLYVLFAVGMVPLTGQSGIQDGGWYAVVYDIAGLVAVLSPFLLLFIVGSDILREELNMGKMPAYALTLCIPLVLLMLGLTSVVAIFSLTGGVFLGSLSLLIVYMYRKRFPKRTHWVQFLLYAIYSIGLVIEIFQNIL